MNQSMFQALAFRCAQALIKPFSVVLCFVVFLSVLCAPQVFAQTVAVSTSADNRVGMTVQSPYTTAWLKVQVRGFYWYHTPSGWIPDGQCGNTLALKIQTCAHTQRTILVFNGEYPLSMLSQEDLAFFYEYELNGQLYRYPYPMVQFYQFASVPMYTVHTPVFQTSSPIPFTP